MRTCWAQWLLIGMVLVLGTGSLLSACGQKGPLYLPDQKQSKTEPAR